MSRRPATRQIAELDIRHLISDALLDRFWSKVIKGQGSDACWLWRGHDADSVVYPRFQIAPGLEAKVSRLAWTLSNGGVIPADTVICHTCDTPPCCRPDHLFPGSVQDNSDDCVAKMRQAHSARHPRVKLTEEQARVIRETPISYGYRRRLATDFGVSMRTITEVRAGRNWKYLDDERRT